MARKHLEKLIYPDETAIVYHMHVGNFQNLMAFMGFENGLCAMYEEPEECLALFDFWQTFTVRWQTRALITISLSSWG
jgi:hypothetical protein